MHTILINKTCLITGATGGIGSQIAHELAKNRCNLLLTGRNQKRLETLKKDILSSRGNEIIIHYQNGDLNILDDVDNIIKVTRNKFKSVDILINCAGHFPVKTLTESTLDDYNKTFNLHVRAPFLFTKEFSLDMMKNKWGRIVNIGSSSAYDGFPDTSLYCSSKHALLGFSRSIQKELKEYNIRTYSISPSGTKTEMGQQIPGQNYDNFLNPEEVARYVIFAISFNNELITDEFRLNRMF
ncbi:SDR family NAD(P)-dependent oxidoreductase [Desulfobacter curvatus]|uniref:SDR family NAD(P)-dependent oxidoreductase n=1 Tax=Desulfobacter curvatus TaxID=2290 RepID=UPI000375CCDD|nr:SDR family oxidoreductase [Desulfobacter curvatus]